MSENASPQAKLDFLREWCGLVIHFLGALAPRGVLHQVEGAVTASFERADEAGLVAICDDLTEWVRGLSAGQQRELDAILRSRAGLGLAESAADRAELRVKREHECDGASAQIVVARPMPEPGRSRCGERTSSVIREREGHTDDEQSDGRAMDGD